jgi:hypothetical protein
MDAQTKKAEMKIRQSDISSVKEEVARTNYGAVRIKKFPFLVQCWTFRRFTFFETLNKVKELGIDYLQPYPGQLLSPDMPRSAAQSRYARC